MFTAKKTRNILYEFKLRRVIIAKFYSHPHAAIFRFSDICLLSYQQDRRPLERWSHKQHSPSEGPHHQTESAVSHAPGHQPSFYPYNGSFGETCQYNLNIVKYKNSRTLILFKKFFKSSQPFCTLYKSFNLNFNRKRCTKEMSNTCTYFEGRENGHKQTNIYPVFLDLSTV